DGAPHRAGGAVQRGQACRGRSGARHPHVRRGADRARRARRRRRLRSRRGGAGIVLRAARDAPARRALGGHPGRGDLGGAGHGRVPAPAGAVEGGCGMIRVVVVDDHPVVRDGVVATLSAAPGLEVVGQAASGPEAVRLTAARDPDVVVMDLRMPGGGGVEAVREMRARGLRAAVLVLTTYDTDSETVAAIEAGAIGYLLKDSSTETLIAAIRSPAPGGPA